MNQSGDTLALVLILVLVLVIVLVLVLVLVLALVLVLVLNYIYLYIHSHFLSGVPPWVPVEPSCVTMGDNHEYAMVEEITMGWLKPFVDTFATKLISSELRQMEENLQGHEVVRQIFNGVTSYKLAGDPTWPLRMVRTTGTTKQNNKNQKITAIKKTGRTNNKK